MYKNLLKIVKYLLNSFSSSNMVYALKFKFRKKELICTLHSVSKIN